MPHNWCPPSRRGHTWKELPSHGSSPIRPSAELRQCARCKALGRVNKNGLIDVVEAP